MSRRFNFIFICVLSILLVLTCSSFGESFDNVFLEQTSKDSKNIYHEYKFNEYQDFNLLVTPTKSNVTIKIKNNGKFSFNIKVLSYTENIKRNIKPRATYTKKLKLIKIGNPPFKFGINVHSSKQRIKGSIYISK